MSSGGEASRLRFGVIGCSKFAQRAMMPAMREGSATKLMAVASRHLSKALDCAARFGCDGVEGYNGLLDRSDIDAVYVALPPALHAEWVSRSLDAGKHVLVEKPSVLDAAIARSLVGKAKDRQLLMMENILYPHHGQFAWVRERIASGELGRILLFRSTFTIPPLRPDDFRYDSSLGGGALWDQGPYMVHFARTFLGNSASLLGATTCEDPATGLIMSGTATFANDSRQVAQVAYGFDTHYQNAWEFLGTNGKMVVDRAFTAPPGHTPLVHIERHNEVENIFLPADNHYQNMCECFARAVLDRSPFDTHWDELLSQATYLEELRARAQRL